MFCASFLFFFATRLTSANASSARFEDLLSITTLAPRAAQTSARTSPVPEVQPVTQITLPLRVAGNAASNSPNQRLGAASSCLGSSMQPCTIAPAASSTVVHHPLARRARLARVRALGSRTLHTGLDCEAKKCEIPSRAPRPRVRINWHSWLNSTLTCPPIAPGPDRGPAPRPHCLRKTRPRRRCSTVSRTLSSSALLGASASTLAELRVLYHIAMHPIRGDTHKERLEPSTAARLRTTTTSGRSCEWTRADGAGCDATRRWRHLGRHGRGHGANPAMVGARW